MIQRICVVFPHDPFWRLWLIILLLESSFVCDKQFIDPSNPFISNPFISIPIQSIMVQVTKSNFLEVRC
jgi:hypothetical protein